MAGTGSTHRQSPGRASLGEFTDKNLRRFRVFCDVIRENLARKRQGRLNGSSLNLDSFLPFLVHETGWVLQEMAGKHFEGAHSHCVSLWIDTLSATLIPRLGDAGLAKDAANACVLSLNA